MGRDKHRLRKRGVIIIDRALSGGIKRQLLIYFLVVIFSFLLLMGIACFFRIPLISGKAEGFGDFWTMLFFFYDGGLEGTLPSNRWFVYLVNVVGSILMGGLLIATLTNFLQSRREKAENGLLRYRLSGHAVFIGSHPSMVPLIQAAIEQNEQAVILCELTPGEVKNRFLNNLTNHQERNIVHYCGPRLSQDELASLCLESAQEVYIFPDAASADPDSENLDVVEMIADICKAKGRKGLRCTVVFLRDSIVSCFERSDVNAHIRQYVDFAPVIYGDTVARNLLSGNVFGNGVLDRDAIDANSNKRVHLFVFGLWNIGQALFVQAARQLHFPNYQIAKTHITLVGALADIQDIKARYREFFSAMGEDYVDMSVQFIPMDATRDIDSAVDKAVHNPDELVTICVCLDDSAAALSRAISLPRSVYENAVPVWLYKPDSDAIAKLMGANAFYSNIVPFGNPEKIFVENPNTLVAQRINWVYSYYSMNGADPNSLPDEQAWKNEWIPAWNRLTISKKWSNLHHADSLPVKIRSMRIDVAEPLTESQLYILSRVEHNRWVAETLLAGFRPPTREERKAMEKDITLKEIYKKQLIHLDLCSYDELLPDANGVDVRDYDRVIEECIPLLMK